MNTFFIGAAQLNLSPTDNFDLLTQKSKSYVARFPYLEMLVFSELAVGGGGALNDKYYLDRYLEKLSSLASELNIWLVPGSFYEKTDEENIVTDNRLTGSLNRYKRAELDTEAQRIGIDILAGWKKGDVVSAINEYYEQHPQIVED